MKKWLAGIVVSAVVHEIAKDEIHAWFARHGGKCPCGWLSGE